MRSKTSPEVLHQLNIASGISMATGIYAVFISLSIVFTPHKKWGPSSLLGWVINNLSPFVPLVAFLALAGILFFALARERFLLPALCSGAAVFLFWALVPFLAAHRGAIDYPTIFGTLNYVWFASISGYGVLVSWRLRAPRGGRFS